MKLKPILEKLDDLPKEFHALYEKSDAGYVLTGIEDKDYTSKITEFRENNIKLTKEMEKLKKDMEKYKGVDLDKYNKALESYNKAEGDEERKLLEAGKFDEVVTRRTSAMKADFDNQIKAKDAAVKAKDSEVSTLRNKLGSLLIDREIQVAISKTGAKLRPSALEDVLARARNTWKINEKGEMHPTDPSGETRFGKDGNPLTMDEYANSLLETATHLFEGGKGGGAAGSQGSSGSGKRTIDGADPMAFGKNLEDIAKGKVEVSVKG